jgi:hypothetical protein
MAEIERSLVVEALAEAALSQSANSELETALIEKVWARRREELYARALAEVTEREQEEWRAKGGALAGAEGRRAAGAGQGGIPGR